MGVKYKEILPVSNSGDLRGILGGVNPSPCSQNQMYDLPPRERNFPTVGYRAEDWTHGSLPSVQCSRNAVEVPMSTYVHLRMVIFIRSAKKIFSPCQFRSMTICDEMRSGLHTFNNVKVSVNNQYTLFIVQYCAYLLR